MDARRHTARQATYSTFHHQLARRTWAPWPAQQPPPHTAAARIATPRWASVCCARVSTTCAVAFAPEVPPCPVPRPPAPVAGGTSVGSRAGTRPSRRRPPRACPHSSQVEHGSRRSSWRACAATPTAVRRRPIRPPEHLQKLVSARSAGALGGGSRAFEAYLHVMKSLEAGEHVLVQG